MGYTPYELVYGRFLDKIKDYPILKQLEDNNQDFVKKVLHGLLVGAIAHFMYGGQKLKNRDDNLEQFNEELSELEVEILAKLMVTEYLSPILISSDKLEKRLSSKDFNEFSSANLIREIREIRESEYASAVDLMNVNYHRGSYL